MIRTFIFYTYAIISLLLSLFGTIKANYLGKKGDFNAQSQYIYKMTTGWAKRVIKFSGSKVTINGLENIPKNQTVLVVSNHQSYFDIPLLMIALPFPKGFIAKKELAKWLGVRIWMKKMRCVFMDRDNMRKSAEAIVDGINILKSGHSMVIFPEGTRSKGGPTHEFKSGSFKLATKSGVPILPVTLDGTYNMLEGTSDKKRIKATNIEITIHKLIDVASLSSDEIKKLHETVEQIVIAPLK